MTHHKTSPVTRARNSLRPFFNWHQENRFRAKKRPIFWKQIQEVRQSLNRSNYSDVLPIVEENRAYPFPGLGNTFPFTEAHALEPALAFLKPLKLSAEAGLQVARLNHHSERLSHALQSLANINRAIVSGQLSEAESALARHKEQYGLSLTTMKKELLVALEKDGLPGLTRKYRVLTENAQSTAWALLAHYAYDLIDPTYSPLMATLRWLRIADERVDRHQWYARILQDEILTHSVDSATMSCAFLRYSALSLLDLAICIWRKHNIHDSNNSLQDAFHHLDVEIRQTLEQQFHHLSIPIAQQYKRRGEDFSDVDLYRISFLFDDIAAVALWRSQLNQLVFSDYIANSESDIAQRSTELRQASADLAKNPRIVNETVNRLAAWEDAFVIKGLEFKSRPFLSAALISDSVRRMTVGPNNDPDVIAELLSETDDIQFFMSTDTMRALLSTSATASSPLLTFVLWELIYRRHRTQDNELDRRLAFMSLFNNGDTLIHTLDAISQTAPATSLLLARTCSRTFLERLFMMMSSVKDVLDARVAVCSWLIDRDDAASDNLKEERDALLRELDNLEARSDLDSTRVHVDEESLREWFETLHASTVSRYKQTALAEGSDTPFGTLLNFFSNIDKPAPQVDDFTAETQVGSEFLLVTIIDSTLKTFVSDRTFGLDAYLSRRIRHGTLNGHVMTPITRVLGQLTEISDIREKAHELNGSSEAIKLAEGFRTFLVAELDCARKDIIQIRSPEHPKGLIQAQWRTAVNLQHLDAMIARVRGRVIETNGSYDVFPDIYSFCWDCLESDLAQLRLYMLRDFYPAALRKLVELYEQLSSPEEKEFAAPFVVECKKTLEARVQEVCGWFIRPVFRRDRYSLKMLISTTLSIVRELDYEYAFSEEVIVSDDISLNRGSFDLFGDALFVLLGNAARHGRRDGKITVAANLLPDNSDVVQLDVTSEVSSETEFNDALSRIQIAFDTDQQSIAQAAVREGFSGLMKLAGLMRRVRSADVGLWLTSDTEQLQITFSLTLPSEITVTRMQT